MLIFAAAFLLQQGMAMEEQWTWLRPKGEQTMGSDGISPTVSVMADGDGGCVFVMRGISTLANPMDSSRIVWLSPKGEVRYTTLIKDRNVIPVMADFNSFVVKISEDSIPIFPATTQLRQFKLVKSSIKITNLQLKGHVTDQGQPAQGATADPFGFFVVLYDEDGLVRGIRRYRK